MIDERIRNALNIIRRFRFLPHSLRVTAMFIQTKVMAAALYGIEVAEPSGHLLRQLQSAIADVFGPRSARACPSLVFELHNYVRDLDPHVQQLVRRATLFRRMWHEHPSIQGIAKDIWESYHTMGVQGTKQDQH